MKPLKKSSLLWERIWYASNNGHGRPGAYSLRGCPQRTMKEINGFDRLFHFSFFLQIRVSAQVKSLSHPVVPPLVPVILAMMAGILAGSTSDLSHPVRAVLVPGCLSVLCVFGSPGRKITLVCLCLTAGVWSGYQSYFIHHPPLTPGHVSNFYNQPGITLTGKIVSFSRQYSYKIRVEVDCKTLTAAGDGTVQQTMPVNGRVYLNIYGNPGPAVGIYDRIRFAGPIRPIRNFGNPGAFDYQTFLKRQGIFGAIHTGGDRVVRISDDPLPIWTRGIQDLEKARNRFHGFVMTRLDHHRNGAHILAALVTGIKHWLPTDLRDLFAKAGASHLLAISGLHLGILCLIFFFGFYRALSLFPRLLISARAKKLAGVITLVPLFLYAVFSGFSPSTQRAFIMTGIFMFSFLGERQSHPVNTLAGAGILILFADPASLFSISFQLSFTAVLFIILGMGVIGKYGGVKIPKVPGFFVSICVVTVLAGLGTFPLIAGYFNLVSFIQVPANLVLVPVIGFVCLPLGLLSLMVWPVFPGLAHGLLTLAATLAEWCTGYIAWLTDLAFAWAYVPALSMGDLAAVYLVMAAVLCACYIKKARPVMVGAVVLLAGLYGLRMTLQPESLDHMTITVLDVGQGNAALIQTVEGKNILVDGGGFSGGTGFDVGRYVVAPFLWHQGVTALDAVILTHPDSDHMNGLVFIMENFLVGTLVKNKDVSTRKAYDRIMAACRKRDIPVMVPDCETDSLAWDSTRLQFFQCASVGPDLTPNDHSVVFKLTLHRFSMLFAGDIMAKRERRLVAQADKNLTARLLLAPHHGSDTSSTDGFLNRVQPEGVIISCGFKNPYRFPHPNVLERYRHRDVKIFRTDDHGAVTITSDGTGYAIATHYPGSG
jgi:competence protein ComEC